jgi:HSP20 family protein
MTLLNTLIPSLSRSPANREQPENDAGRKVRPVYDVKETQEAWGVTVHLPGVAKDGVELSAEQGQIRITGRRAWKQPEGWTCLYRESPDAEYELVLTHDNVVDVDKIAAELRDGVLRVSLPKHEAIKPRKITIG